MAVKKTRKALPVLKESAHDIWLAGLGALATASEEGSKMFKTLVKRGAQVDKSNKVRINHLASRARTLRGEAKAAMARVANPIEDRMTGAIHRLGVPTRKEIATLTKRVEELTRVVAKSRKTSRRPRASRPASTPAA